jgi:hypothetical protein
MLPSELELGTLWAQTRVRFPNGIRQSEVFAPITFNQLVNAPRGLS